MSFSIISVIYVFVDNLEVTGGMHILTVVMPSLLIKAVLSQFRRLFKRILNGEFMRLEDHAIHFGVLLEDFMTKEKHNALHSLEDKSFLPNRESFYGILSGKENIQLEKLENKKTVHECEVQIFCYIVEKLHLVSIQMPHLPKVLALYKAQLYLTKVESNIPRVLEILRKLENSSAGFPMKCSIEYLNTLLQKTYNQDGWDSENRSGLSHYFKYYDLTSNIKNLMLEETKKQIEFWEDIRSRNIDAKKIYDKTREIDSLFARIYKQCERNLNNFRKNFRSPMLLYSVYLNNVRHMHFDGTQVLRNFESIMMVQNLHHDQFDTTSENTAVVIVSLDKTKPGIILNASGSIHSLFNLRKTELIGKKIGCLFPGIIAKHYQLEIQQYSKNPVYNLNAKEKTYGKTTNDEIFELEVSLQLYPYVNKELTVMVMLKKLDDPAPVLI
ncbi:MAG: hypothetical protein EOO43_18780, partial [Flavobacterium sp.]